MTILSDVRERLRRISILQRIAIGNAAIIVIGAVGGTLITRHLAREAADFWLIISFAGLGIFLSVLTNYLLIRTALRPLHELSELVDRVQAGHADLAAHLPRGADPDIDQLASALQQLVEQLADRSRKLSALSERAINAQEDERRRIARGLHDETAQALSMLIITLERIEQGLPDQSLETREKLVSARHLATATLKDLRQVILGLRPTILDDLGLISAIRWYARANLESEGVRVEFDLPDEPLGLSSRVETTLFRIAQEAISNILRHAHTDSALISLSHHDARVCLWIDDHGRGFDVARTSDAALELRRLGLLGIQERASLVGGDVLVDSTPGEGTRLRVCVPVAGIAGGTAWQKSASS